MEFVSDSVKVLLVRIIGNDLPPLHSPEQTLRNLRYILENEPSFPNCKKYFLINRVVDVRILKKITDLLSLFGIPYSVLPFDISEPIYKQQRLIRLNPEIKSWVFNDYFLSNNKAFIEYGTDVNYARNKSFTMIEDEDVILIFDGNSYLTIDLYQDFYIKAKSKVNSREKIYVFPMCRLEDLEFQNNATDNCFDFEPQLGFQSKSKIRFNEEFPYGKRSKVELLNRLGIKGYWNKREDDGINDNRKHEIVELVSCKGVYRLPSWTPLDKFKQQPPPEKGSIREGSLNVLYEKIIDLHFLSEENKGFNKVNLPSSELFTAAYASKEYIDYFTSRSESFVSANKAPKIVPINFYHSFAPNLLQLSCDKSVDFIVRKNRNLDQFETIDLRKIKSADWSKLQDFITTIIILSFEYSNQNEIRILKQIENLICDFLLDPKNGMYPNIMFSQSQPSNYDLKGGYKGRNIVDFSRFYLFVIGISRVFTHLSSEVRMGTLEWLRAFGEELDKNKEALKQSVISNNLFTINLLQEMSLAIFFEDSKKLRILYEELITLYCIQFNQDGRQPLEEARNSPIHYRLYNLQFWINIKLLLTSNFVQCFDFDITTALDQVSLDLSDNLRVEDNIYFQTWVDNLCWLSSFETNTLSDSTPNFTEQTFFEGIYSQGSPPYILLTDELFKIYGFNQKN